jgi:hypothetical protein
LQLSGKLAIDDDRIFQVGRGYFGPLGRLGRGIYIRPGGSGLSAPDEDRASRHSMQYFDGSSRRLRPHLASLLI